MINHVRSLFLNRNGTPVASTSVPGEEFVDPDFVKKQVPAAIRSALRTIFGSNPDRTYLNYRLRQIMELLHASELEGFVLDFDPRITYYPFENDEFLYDVFKTEVNTVAGVSQLLMSGEHVADDGAGITRLQWNVQVTASNEVTVLRRTPPIVTSTTMFAAGTDRSGQLSLPGSGLKVEILQPQLGDEWEIYSVGRPQLGLSDLLPAAARTIGATGFIELFGLSPVEPLLTYKELWENNEIFGYKYGGLLLAMATLLDAAPQDQT